MLHTLSNRVLLTCGLVALAAGTASAIVACGSSSSGGDTSTDGGSQASGDGAGGSSGPRGDAGIGTVSKQPGACTNSTVQIIFSPMYSAFIPGSTDHSFSVPAVTADGNPATWSLSDPAQANLQLQSFQNGTALVPGVMVTVAGGGNDAGQVTVIATESDGSCGTSVLTITQNTVNDWMIGSARYNNGTALMPYMPDGGFPGFDGNFPDGGFIFDGNFPDGFSFDGSFFPGADATSIAEVDGGTACTNCHGPTATNGPFKTVSHTPEQTGGFSDTELANIILNGQVPEGGYFDPSVLVPGCDGGATCTAQAMGIWHYFHRWSDITPDELPGVICYLRSLTPQAQAGMSNFGGFFRRDAGQ
jgi:hypothetical protein